ncbi:MAG: hypothetical protein ACQEXJ_17740 [Myxococcota bacterium]
MSKGFDFLVSCLERRYDHHSARIMGQEVLSQAGLEEKKEYSDQEIQQVADTLGAVGDGNLDEVWLALGTAPSGIDMPAAEEPAPEGKGDEDEPESKKDEKKEEAKEEKAESKKGEGKKDDKEEKKSSKGGKKK